MLQKTCRQRRIWMCFARGVMMTSFGWALTLDGGSGLRQNKTQWLAWPSDRLMEIRGSRMAQEGFNGCWTACPFRWVAATDQSTASWKKKKTWKDYYNGQLIDTVLQLLGSLENGKKEMDDKLPSKKNKQWLTLKVCNLDYQNTRKHQTKSFHVYLSAPKRISFSTTNVVIQMTGIILQHFLQRNHEDESYPTRSFVSRPFVVQT